MRRMLGDLRRRGGADVMLGVVLVAGGLAAVLVAGAIALLC